MEARLLQALFAKPAPVIMGCRLRPFSLAHRVALTALDSPLLKPHTPVTPEALLVAAKVCSSSNPFSPISRPSFREKVLFWRMRFDHKRHIAEAERFVAYIADHTAHPEMWERESMAPGDGIPWPLHIVARLVRNGVPITEAWGMSEGIATWLNITFARQEGAELSVITERDRKAMEILDSVNAQPTPAHG